MTVALQIRDVPEDVRDVLAAQASSRGQSLQGLLLGLVNREAQAASCPSMFDRTAHLRIDLRGFDPVTVIREGRDDGLEIDRDAL